MDLGSSVYDTDAVTWSPDSQYMLISRHVPEDGGQGRVDLFSADGTLMQGFDDFETASWLDDRRFLLVDVAPRDRSARATFLGAVGSTELEEVGVEGFPLPNGQGAAAFEAPFNFEFERFTMWTPEDGRSGSHPGHAASWSRDGAMLAIERSPLYRAERRHDVAGSASAAARIGVPPGITSGSEPTTHGTSGWLEVLRWPGLERVFPDRPRQIVSGGLGFDPTGGFMWYLQETRGQKRLSIVDFATGEIVEIWPATGSWLAWNATPQLVVPDRCFDCDVPVSVYDVDGDLVTGGPELHGNRVSASADGTTLILYWNSVQDFTHVNVVRDGQTSRLEVPVPCYPSLDAPYPIVRPDGDALILQCLVDETQHAFLYRF